MPHSDFVLCSNGCAIMRRKRFECAMATSVARFVSDSLMYWPIHLGSLLRCGRKEGSERGQGRRREKERER